MANEMLDESFRNSHQDLVGMEISAEDHDDESTTLKMDDGKEDSKQGSKQTISPTTRKSVDFAILPPPKRSRPSPEWTLKQAIEAISIAVSTEDRLESIQKARDCFSHDVQSLHDEELDAGADAVLTKHLAFLLWPLFERRPDRESGNPPEKIDHESVSAELSLALEALESIYRASSERVGRSFKRLGNELLKIILTTLNQEIDRLVHQNLVVEESDDGDDDISSDGERSDDCDDENEGGGKNDDTRKEHSKRDQRTPELRPSAPKSIRSYCPSPEGENVVKKATRIIGHFARVGEATKPLAHFPGLLGTLVRLILLHPYDRIPWEARLSAIWTIANLGCNGENMQMMVCTPGLIESLIQVSCRSLHPGDSVETTVEVLRGRSIASRCILNLSWSPENKIVLGEQAALIDLLTELAVHRHSPLSNSRTVREILVTTRRHAVGALRNLAAAPRRTKIALAEYKNGHVLSVLTDAALNDPDTAVTDRAFAAIANLAIHDTAEQMVNHPALVLALKDVLLSSEENEKVDREEGSPRAHAAATLLVLERTILPDMAAYENLRDLLDALNPSPPTDEEDNDDSIKVDQVTAV